MSLINVCITSTIEHTNHIEIFLLYGQTMSASWGHHYYPDFEIIKPYKSRIQVYNQIQYNLKWCKKDRWVVFQ